jgi:nicotinamide riboside kinase
MTITISDDDLQTRTAFHEALTAIVRRARENAVVVEGGWECRTDGGGNYEAVIVELLDSERE